MPWLAVLVAGLSSPAGAAVSVSIDTTVAQAVLRAATAEPAQVPALAQAALALPGLAAMIAKEHRYNAQATAQSFSGALAAVAQGGTANPMTSSACTVTRRNCATC